MKNFPIEEKSACLITDRLTRKYLIGVDVAEGYLIIGKEVCCFTDARYFSGVKTTLSDVGVKPYLLEGLTTIENYLKSVGITKLFVDFDKTTVSEFERYKQFGFPILDCSIHLKKVRAVKDDEELEFIKRAADIAEKAYHTAIKDVKLGVTEIQLKDRIEELMIKFGADGVAFETIVAFGSHAAVPHHVTGDTALENDTEILVDMGANYKGYLSDLTRTAFFGKPNSKFIEVYERVKEANEVAIDSITAGMTTRDADKIARDVLKKYDLSKYFTHSLGHGVGLEVHEFPLLSSRTDDELKEGMVFTIEPGVYMDGELGIRIEDTVVIKNGKVERLFNDEKNLLKI